MFKRILAHLASHLPYRVIYGGGGEEYLTRYKFFDQGHEGMRLYLHQFHRGDEDREVHDHPWDFAYSLILAGGYEEQRLEYGLQTRYWDNNEVTQPFNEDRTRPGYVQHGPRYVTRTFRPGMVNVIRPDTFHRVTLHNGEAWSIILTGPIHKSWGFLSATGRFTPWKMFLVSKGLAVNEGDADDGKKFHPPRAFGIRRTITNILSELLP